MLVSILINSYNYDRYVGATIDSALRQTYPNVEVVVVDDGSTDRSWEVICSYKDRVRAKRLDNGGQAAAYNAAMTMARGEYMLFLDSDDLLDADAIEACVAALGTSDAAKVQFRLRLIDAQGALLGGRIPYLMHSGDLRQTVNDFGHYAGPPGSGNLYRRSAIESCFPIPTEPWRRGGADSVPFIACAFYGEVISLEREHGSYRLHQTANASLGIFGNTDRSWHESLRREASASDRLRHSLDARFTSSWRCPLLPTPTQSRTRALSWKLDRAHHPYPQDDAPGLYALCGEVLARWPGYNRSERLALKVWLIMILLLPSALCKPLARVSAGVQAKRTLKWWSLLVS